MGALKPDVMLLITRLQLVAGCVHCGSGVLLIMHKQGQVWSLLHACCRASAARGDRDRSWVTPECWVLLAAHQRQASSHHIVAEGLVHGLQVCADLPVCKG